MGKKERKRERERKNKRNPLGKGRWTDCTCQPWRFINIFECSIRFERERERGGIKKTMEKSRIRSVISRGVREKHADSLENNFVGKLIKSFRFGRWKLLRRMHLSFCQIIYRWIYLNLRGEENNSIFAIIHLRVPSLEDLDNGNRVWYIAGLTLEPKGIPARARVI